MDINFVCMDFLRLLTKELPGQEFWRTLNPDEWLATECAEDELSELGDRAAGMAREIRYRRIIAFMKPDPCSIGGSMVCEDPESGIIVRAIKQFCIVPGSKNEGKMTYRFDILGGTKR